MRMQHLLGVSIVGIVASTALSAAPGVSSGDIEALITRHQESMTSRQVEAVDQKLEKEAEILRLSLLPTRQPAVLASWLALVDPPQAPGDTPHEGKQGATAPVSGGEATHKGMTMSEINNG